MSRKPAITALLNGQAVNVAFGSTRVTVAFASWRFTSRAQVAPANPPPMTTTRGAACANKAGAKSGASGPAPSICTKALRVGRALTLQSAPNVARKPDGDRARLIVRKTFGDAVHDRG